MSPWATGRSGFWQSVQFTWTFPEVTASAAFPRLREKPTASTLSSRREDTVSRISLVFSWGGVNWASMEKLRDAAGGCACCIAAHRAVFRDPASVAAGNLALLDRVGGEMLELLRTPLTLGELVAAVVERKKLLTRSELKAARYARSVQCFVEYLRDTGRLDVVVDRGMRRFVRR